MSIISKKILSAVVLSTALIFSASANAEKKPKFCSEKVTKNCVDKRDYYEDMYEKVIAKTKQYISKNPDDGRAQEFLKFAETLHNAFETYCGFTNSHYYVGFSETDIATFNCERKYYEKLMNEIMSYYDFE